MNTVIFSHHKLRREFVLSAKTKATTLKVLLKKALNLQSQIKYLKSNDDQLSLEQVLRLPAPSKNYQIVLDDDSDDDRSRSEVCSQKNMSKVSGRKNPPSEKELLDSKFYIDDFQLFMAEISGSKNNRLFGIIFFNNRKKASFLGKKILRELVFEFDKIEFFYALHPIKMHTTSALLGQVLVFSLFRGRRMIHQREFPEQITAADEILNYIKKLVKVGEVSFEREQPKRPKNLIHVQEQRSFDHKIETSPEKLSDFGGKPNRTTELIKVKPITPDKQVKARKIFTNPKQQSPSKSHITNEISFENDLFQPEWFTEGSALTRIEKAVLSALIKNSDSNLLNFLQGLNLKSASCEQLNIKLVKVFIKEVLDGKLKQFSEGERQFVYDNQQNRKSFVFNSLLKLFKFGDLSEFLETLRRGNKQVLTRQQTPSLHPHAIQIQLLKPQSHPQLPSSLSQSPPGSQVNYSSIAKENDRGKGAFTIKLLDCDNEQESSLEESFSPFRESAKLRIEHVKIAKLFHFKTLETISLHNYRTAEFNRQFTEPEKAAIQDLILKNDAFMIQNFIRNPEKSKVLDKLPTKTVKKYIKVVESRYERIRQRTLTDQRLRMKMTKLQNFHGLLYYLYKQRIINEKQLKIGFYLYTWSDLNTLGAFELYLLDRNIDEFVDNIYAIDYNYYLNNLYEIDHSEVVQFTLETQLQLIILFLFEDYIVSGEERISLQKFIRAGDTAVLQMYSDISIPFDSFIQQLQELTRSKREVLKHLAASGGYNACEEEEKKKDRCGFIDQIVATRYKGFTKKDLVKECINNEEPVITNLFDRLDQHNQQQQFVQAFNDYIQTIDQTHMKMVLEQLCQEGGIVPEKIEECRGDVLKGIYEVYMQTKDKLDTIDSLERSIKRSPRSTSK